MGRAGDYTGAQTMRLGLLGPALDHQAHLERAAAWLRDEQKVERVLYLGADSALDQIVSRWAAELVGPKAEDTTIMTRAAARCLHGDPSEIDEFLGKEERRSALRMFESLPGETTRSVELVGGKVAVMLYDKAYLEEDDILPATLLIFGKSQKPLIRQVGRRWFLSPGSFPQAGIMVVDDVAERLTACAYDEAGSVIEKRALTAPKTLRMRASGTRS